MTGEAQRAEKEPFYASALNESERERLDRALEIEGFNDEIALLRVKLHELAKQEHLDMIARAVNSIVRAVQVRHSMSPEDAESVKRVMLEEVERATRELDRV